MNQQDPQLGRVIVSRDQEHTTEAAVIHRSDPRPLPSRIVPGRVIGHDTCHQRLELDIPAKLGGIHLAMGHHYPAQITRLPQRPDHRVDHHRSSSRITDTTVSVAA